MSDKVTIDKNILADVADSINDIAGTPDKLYKDVELAPAVVAAHLLANEKEQHFVLGSYIGDGVPKREIPLEFKPLFGILFAVDQALSLPDMADSSLGVLCGGFFTPDGGTYGLEMKGNSLVVYQSMNSSGPVTMHHNILNVQYIYLLVR